MRKLIPVLFASSALALAACQAKPPPDPRAAAPLVAVMDVRGGGAAERRFTGVVRARVESDLGFRIAGKVVERLVDAGQAVRKGQALMRLDPADLALGVNAQRSNVEAARARSIQADADFKRLQGLVEQGAISASAFDQARAAADSARAELAAAEAQARVAGNAKDYALLTADADGVVEETRAEPGQVVSAGQTVILLAHAGPREAEVGLPETVRPAAGAPARASLYGQAGADFAAVLRQLSQSADPVTRTYDARFVLKDAGAAAPLGATITLSLPDGAPAGGTEAPLGALYDPGSGPGVWIVENDRVRFHPVKLLALKADRAMVSPLPGDLRIVALGADRLHEGERVRTMPVPAPDVIAGGAP